MKDAGGIMPRTEHFSNISKVCGFVFLMTITTLFCFSTYPTFENGYHIMSSRVTLTLEEIVRQFYEKDNVVHRWEKNTTLENIVRDYIRDEVHLTIKPDQIELIEEHLNPCWKRTNSSVIDCLPSFYIAGFPKCATTDLWQRLVQHPQIYGKKGFYNKEFRWWTTQLPHLNMSFDEYITHFANVGKHKDHIGGDGTPFTLYRDFEYSDRKTPVKDDPHFNETTRLAFRNHEVFPPHIIVQYTPKAKFIVLMREPTARLYSKYLQIHRYFRHPPTNRAKDPHGYDLKPSPKEFHDRALHNIQQFNDCLKVNTTRRCLFDQELTYTSFMLSLTTGIYAKYIKDTLQLVPRENLMFIRFEDYMKNRDIVLSQILQFLGVRNNPDIMRSVQGEQYIPNTSNTSPKKVPFEKRVSDSDGMPMLPETWKAVREFYRPYNEELAKLMNDTRYLFQDN